MAGSIFGNIFKISTWGESHGAAVGVTVDGCPAGVPLTEEDIQVYLNRRKPGQSAYTTTRKEDDTVEILSGVFEGKTTGTPISMIVRNTSQRSGDYGNIAYTYRPGHADYCFDEKYGFRDYRGGGRSSGRETIGRVAAGAIALKILKEMNITVDAYTVSIGDISIDRERFNLEESRNNPVCMPDGKAAKAAGEYLDGLKAECDSAGGKVECVVNGVPAGIGEPVFDKLDALLAHGIMSIGAVKAVEIGEGTGASLLKGSENNDNFYMDGGKVATKTNHAGGILGGISNGQKIVLTATFKPTPSIFKEQSTIDKDKNEVVMSIKGRHDPVVVPRAVVVVEAMTAIVILDLLLMSVTNDINKIKKILND
ncbi:MAG: chorismate synthase [Lachnospiraceae bacterium]|nr:chorismate synthase [Lachnospiraceae bacterium]